jgi:hypothetical protein
VVALVYYAIAVLSSQCKVAEQMPIELFEDRKSVKQRRSVPLVVLEFKFFCEEANCESLALGSWHLGKVTLDKGGVAAHCYITGW